MSVSLNSNVSQVDNTKKNLVSKKTDNSKKNSLSTETKIAISTGLVALAAVGIYIATRGKVKSKSISPEVVTKPFRLPSFSSDKTEILNILKSTEYVKPSIIPSDILKIDDILIGGPFVKEGKNILMHNSEGKILRKYVPTPDGKKLLSIVDYNVTSGKPQKIVKYSNNKPINILDFDDAGNEVKRTVFWDGTDKLKGIVTKGSDRKDLTVKFKENGTDIDYIHNLSSDFGDIGSVKF